MSKHTKRQINEFCFPTCDLMLCLPSQFAFYLLSGPMTLSKQPHFDTKPRVRQRIKEITYVTVVSVVSRRSRKKICDMCTNINKQTSRQMPYPCLSSSVSFQGQLLVFLQIQFHCFHHASIRRLPLTIYHSS